MQPDVEGGRHRGGADRLGGGGAGARTSGDRAARARRRSFQVDPAWPKMPKQWILGQVSGLDVDARDHVWIIQRPWSLNDDEKAKNPEAECCTPAPPVMEFDAAGNYLQGWGGEAPGVRVAEGRAHHPRRLQRQRLDFVGRRTAPARAHRESDSEVHAGGEVPVPGRASRQEQGQPRHRELQQRRRHLRLPEDQRSLRRRRLRQPPHHRARRRHRRVQADVGRVRQRARRCGAEQAGG